MFIGTIIQRDVEPVNIDMVGLLRYFIKMKTKDKTTEVRIIFKRRLATKRKNEIVNEILKDFPEIRIIFSCEVYYEDYI